MSGGPSAHIDKPDLPPGRIRILGEKAAERIRGREAVTHHREPSRPEAWVGVRLRGDCAGAGACPRHDGADCEKLRGDRHPDLAGLGVGGDYGKRRDDLASAHDSPFLYVSIH
jgi:hypothetical protein